MIRCTYRRRCECQSPSLRAKATGWYFKPWRDVPLLPDIQSGMRRFASPRCEIYLVVTCGRRMPVRSLYRGHALTEGHPAPLSCFTLIVRLACFAVNPHFPAGQTCNPLVAQRERNALQVGWLRSSVAKNGWQYAPILRLIHYSLWFGPADLREMRWRPHNWIGASEYA